MRYIHLNPVRACIVTSAVEYPWSSHHAYLGRRTEPWVTTEFSLTLFHPEAICAVTAYDRFMRDETRTESPLTECNPNDRRILGSDTFAARLLGTAWRPHSQKTLDELIDEACQSFSVNRIALYSSSRHRHLAHARAWIAHQALTLRIASLSHVAHIFGRSEAALRQSVKLHFNYP